MEPEKIIPTILDHFSKINKIYKIIHYLLKDDKLYELDCNGDIQFGVKHVIYLNYPIICISFTPYDDGNLVYNSCYNIHNDEYIKIEDISVIKSIYNLLKDNDRYFQKIVESYLSFNIKELEENGLW